MHVFRPTYTRNMGLNTTVRQPMFSRHITFKHSDVGSKNKVGGGQIVLSWEVLWEVRDVITQLSCTLYLYNTTLLGKGGGGANHIGA